MRNLGAGSPFLAALCAFAVLIFIGAAFAYVRQVWAARRAKSVRGIPRTAAETRKVSPALMGAASVLDMGGTLAPRPEFYRNDDDALAADWRAVGNDMRAAGIPPAAFDEAIEALREAGADGEVMPGDRFSNDGEGDIEINLTPGWKEGS